MMMMMSMMITMHTIASVVRSHLLTDSATNMSRLSQCCSLDRYPIRSSHSVQKSQLTHPALVPCVRIMSKSSDNRAELVEKLAALGKTAAPTCTKMQIKARLYELQEQETNHAGKVLKSLIVQLNKAARKKSDLIDFCKEHKVTKITQHMTISQLYAMAEEHLTTSTPAHGTNLVNFGKLGHLTYQEIKDNHPNYAAWVVTTFQEEDSPHWRLVRLAHWLMNNEPTMKKTEAVRPVHKERAKSSTFAPLGRGRPSSHPCTSESDGSFNMVSSGEMDSTVSKLKAEIQALKEENADLVLQTDRIKNRREM